MATARQPANSYTIRAARRKSQDKSMPVVSEEFCESFHEASMKAAKEITKGKKPRFVKVA